MMTLKLQIVIAIAILAILAVLVNMIRKRSLELKYALVWMMVLAALLIFDCAPVLLYRIEFSGNLCTGKHDLLSGILFFAVDYIFADSSAVPSVQQCADTGSDGGTE